jgi:serine O-acetyltransferase
VELGRFDQNPPGLSFFQLLREDLETHEGNWMSQGFWAIAVHRFGNRRMRVRSRWLRLPLTIVYRIALKLIEWLCGISLAYTVKVGRRVRIWHQGGMVLGALSIGDDVHLRQNTTIGVRRRGDPRWMKPVIESGCDIGAGAVIVGPVVVGQGSIIGANVVVAEDIPAYSIVTNAKPTVRPIRVS